MATGTIEGGHIGKFQDLLRELFQFDCADLDFGIYRIMNHKRDVVERFVSEKLPAEVEGALGEGELARQARADAALEEARNSVLTALHPNALDADGELDPGYSNTLAGKAYLDARAAARGGMSASALEAALYNHLYAFFNRYYEDGDFVSKRRYGRNQRYAIPYNGEEVYLHWANNDQYYVKTEAHFRDYDWNAPNGVAVHFRLRDANLERDNNNGERRFFLPLPDDAEWDESARAVTIPFEYRPLNAAEKVGYGRTNQQEKIIAATVRDVPQRLDDAPDALAALTEERRRNGKDEAVSHLEHHLRQYTRRNDSDFFIHKDLSGFLNRELDFYLKNEVLNLDNLEAAGERAASGWFQLMRLIKGVGGQIIDFLAQIEEFQKMLWEKRKFVVDTQYCVTLGNVDAAFYDEIAANESQWAEWQDLFGVDGSDKGAGFLRDNPTLVVDTRHFPTDFTDRLLASFDDLDGMTDGLLVHSENWQALRLLEEKYRGSVKCVYIDPPYNTDASAILYKNSYKHSSWASLMENRLVASKPFLLDTGVLGFAINDAELKLAIAVLEQCFLGYEVQPIVVNHYPGSGSGRGNVSSTHEYHLMVVPEGQNILVGSKRNGGFRTRNFRRSGQGENNFRWGRPNSFFAILVDPDSLEIRGMEEAVPEGADYPTDNTEEGLLRIYPIGRDGAERVWSRNQPSAVQLWQSGLLECTQSHTIVHHIANEGRKVLTSVWLDGKFNAVVHGTNLLTDLMGRPETFPFPKSIFTVKAAIDAVLDEDTDATVLDYFAGSGTTAHAVINLNREDGGERKFILVEMGDYFHTVLLPRVKKVIYSPEWRDGKPRRTATPEEAERSPRIVKYVRLESYEDALDGIAFDEEAAQLRLEDRIEGYLLRYMLKWETKASMTLLHASSLISPFEYRLQGRSNGVALDLAADVPETFNYLLGLKVRTRRVYERDGQRYVVYRGETRESPGREAVVIWRATEGWTLDEFRRDERFVAEQGITEGADVIYVNGDSFIKGMRPVELLFKQRMFAGVDLTVPSPSQGEG